MAQLVERCVRNAEATSSNLVISTKKGTFWVPFLVEIGGTAAGRTSCDPHSFHGEKKDFAIACNLLDLCDIF